MRIFPLLLIGLAIFSSCRNGGKGGSYASDKYELMDADKAFSAVCREKGMKAAFIEFIDSNGVILPPGRPPLEGAAAIDYIISQDDSEYSLSWKPRDGSISASGDLGYTFGTYTLQVKGSDSPFAGTYITMWKKQGDGKWKFVLYSGNEAIAEKVN